MSTVLIVDDEPGIRQVIELALGAAGHDVVSADDADGARRAVAAQPFDLVLVDVQLAGACGIELLADLQRDHHDLPAVAMTGGWADPAWAFPVLPKPFTIASLLDLVDSAVGPVSAA